MVKHIRYDDYYYFTFNADGSVNLFKADLKGGYHMTIDRWSFNNQFVKVSYV